MNEEKEAIASNTDEICSPFWYAVGTVFTTPLLCVLFVLMAALLLVAWPVMPFVCYFQRKDELKKRRASAGHRLGDWP